MSKKLQKLIGTEKYIDILKPFSIEELESNRANNTATSVMRQSADVLEKSASRISDEFSILGKVFDSIGEISVEISGVEDGDMEKVGEQIDAIFWLMKEMSIHLKARADYINQRINEWRDEE